MPSPFPGVDPFIESQKWKGFHSQFITALGQALVPQVRPRYVIDVEEAVYLEIDDEDRTRPIEPDISVAESREAWQPRATDSGAAIGTAPAILTLPPAPAKVRQHFINVVDRHLNTVVAVIEVLSPWNKSPRRGREEYLSKREAVLETPSHLVEIDLLRGGKRLPTMEPLPPGDYFAFVIRAEVRPKVEVYSWSLRDSLTEIPVPLSVGENDARLDLQAVFTETYDRAGFDYALDYKTEVQPALADDDERWLRELLAAREASA